MNGKQAKRLRRAALGLATTLTEAGRDIKKEGYQLVKHNNPSLSLSNTHDPKGVMPNPDVDPFNAPTYQLKVRADSLKGIYKTLKKG